MKLVEKLRQGVKDRIHKPDPLELRLREVRDNLGVKNVRDVPRSYRSEIAMSLMEQRPKEITEETQGFGMFVIHIGLTLGEDTLVDLIKQEVISTKWVKFPERPLSQCLLRFEQAAIKKGWRQDTP